MPRARANKPLQDKEYRYYVQVYPPNPMPSKSALLQLGVPFHCSVRNKASGDRVHLGGPKNDVDRATADKLFELIRKPREYGDTAECKRRLKLAHRILKSNRTGLDAFIFSIQLEDNKAYLDEWLQENHPHVIKDYEDAHDYDRNHIDRAGKALDSLVESDRDDLIQEHALNVIESIEDTDVLRSIRDKLSQRLGRTTRPKASEHRVADCLNRWETQATQKKINDRYRQQVVRVWKEFVEFIGNPPINRLSKAHVVDWQDHVHAIRNGQGPRWLKQKLQPISEILRLAKKHEEWEFPEGLAEWLQVFDYETYKPKKSNRKALSADHFHKLLAKAHEWGEIDVDEYAAALPLDGANEALVRANNIKQAKRIKRAGKLWSAILRLGVNCGCDNIDVARLEHRHLIDSESPEGLKLFALPRMKVARSVGIEVERRTPLLPSTLQALKDWTDYSGSKSFVFTNDAKRPFADGSKVREGFERLREASGLPKSVLYKHIRNIGGTVGRNHGRPSDERDAFRGQTVGGMSKFYEDDTPDDYLVPLVNLIGAEYFDGEQVGE